MAAPAHNSNALKAHCMYCKELVEIENPEEEEYRVLHRYRVVGRCGRCGGMLAKFFMRKRPDPTPLLKYLEKNPI